MINITKSSIFRWSVALTLIVVISYVLTWRFVPMWWFILIFVDLVAFLLYLIVAICGIIFLITKRNKFSYPFIPLLINILPIAIIIFSPSIYRNKSYPVRAVEISVHQINKPSQRLYLEAYCVHGSGALGSDLCSSYLTDSLNFRKYVGTYDDGEEIISADYKGDSIRVVKISEPRFDSKKTASQIFSLKQLIKQHSFD
jgi:amino acid transporter